MTDSDEFAAQSEEMQRALIELQVLRNADAALGDQRPNWLAARRLAIYARCCQDRAPLVEVMNTIPPCVLLSQVAYSSSAVTQFAERDADRDLWQGARQARGNQGLVWLTTFERQADRGGRQWLWCRHQRWWLSPGDVVTLRGEHADVLKTDTRGQVR